jgi:PAS domain S-box-containing protein
LAFTILDLAGIDLPRSYGTPLGIWAVLMQISLAGAIPVAQILKALNKALEQVQSHSIDLQQREKQLRESEERFRNMANTAPVMIAVIDAKRQAIFFNKTWLDFTARAMEHELGHGWTAGVHPDDLDECLAKDLASQQARIGFEMEYRLRRADGQYRSVMCRGVPRFEPDGAFAGYVETVIDITEMKQALAGQKLESLGVLASGIAHDFNNLLGGILAGSELLLSDVDDASPARIELENIRLTAMRASEIVRQLMVYAGEENAVFEEIDLAELVREMLQLMMISISKNAALKINVPGNVPSIRANKAQMRQVVMNLITNASDALRDTGGTISVSLEQVRTQPKSVRDGVRGVAGGDFLRLEVRDSGCGMSEEIQARIFDPFFSTKRAGRGMGLAAVRGIVQSHGGMIQVQSAVGSGSCFEILLPCAREAERQSSKAVISAPFNEDGKVTATVLMIEDEDTLRVAVTRMLRREGFTILETGDGATGMDLFQAHATEIDIVLLDLTLPGMSGGEILEGLRKIRPNTKVVLSTAYGRDRALSALSEPKSVYYLQKPYQIQELAALLRKVMLDREVPHASANQSSAS